MTLDELKEENKTLRERLNWIYSRVTYLEHKDKHGNPATKVKQGGFWPQTEGEFMSDVTIPELHDLSLPDYLDAVQKAEKE